MKKIFLLAFATCLSIAVSAQEEIGPIMRMFLSSNKKAPVRASNPIDSTYIYTADTLTLPQFDDFSRSRFQVYDAGPGDPNVTEELVHKLLDITNDPLPGNARYSTDPTFRYEYSAGDMDTIPLPSISIQVGNFNAYPVVYTTTVVYPPYDLYDSLDFVNDIDTVFRVPDHVQDSALIFHVEIDDPNSLWLDNHAYHNYTFAIDPPSLGVVTFDGLDETGYPYNFGSVATGTADFLTSKPIDLSMYGPGDPVYLTFVVQPGGFGDPAEAGDSLIVEFYNSIADQWEWAWSVSGTEIPNDQFRVGHIWVQEAAYFTDAFQFRFKNHGGLSGSLDHFHLDRVHLRDNSAPNDTIFRDFAWSYPIGSLLKDYTQVPWDHYKNNPSGKMNDEVRVTVHNGWNVPNNNNLGGRVEVSYGGGLEGQFGLAGATMSFPDADYQPFTTYTSFHDFTGAYEYDPTKPGDEVVFDLFGYAQGQQVDAVTQNDSCFAVQEFRDVYAYDDGSAEMAYGPTGMQARLAVRFVPYEADSLIGVKMHFVPSVVDVSDKLFLLTVWDDDNGEPGNVIYEDNAFNPRTPQYEDAIGKFTDYYLTDTMKLSITGPFYVGWRQVDLTRLNIGMDMNNDNSHNVFYSNNNGATWNNTSYNGSVMIRPIFSTAANADLSVDEAEIAPEWTVYPNPTNGSVTVRWNSDQAFPGAVCLDAQGRTIGVAEEGQSEIDLSGAPAGIYFVRLNGFGQPVKKVIRL